MNPAAVAPSIARSDVWRGRAARLRMALGMPELPHPVELVTLEYRDQRGLVTVNDSATFVIPSLKDFLVVWAVAYLLRNDADCGRWGGVPGWRLSGFVRKHCPGVAASVVSTWQGALLTRRRECVKRWPHLLSTVEQDPPLQESDLKRYFRETLFRKVPPRPDSGLRGSVRLFCLGAGEAPGSVPRIALVNVPPGFEGLDPSSHASAEPGSSARVSGPPSGVPTALRRHWISFDTFVQRQAHGLVGRHFVKAVLEEHLGRPPSHSRYLIIEGEPGIGKSALLSHWVATDRERFAVHHFTRPSNNSAEQFVANICARLVYLFELPYPLPLDRDSDRGRAALLEEVLQLASQRLAEQEKKLVILVDALDGVAADSGRGAPNPLCLPEPEDLPAHVYIVATSRPGWERRFSPPFAEVVRLLPGSRDNLDDVGSFLRGRAEKEPLSGWMREQGKAAEDLVSLLVDKSHGNFMYLRYVLHEIERGGRAWEDLDRMPRGLMGYYRHHCRQMGLDSLLLPNGTQMQSPATCALLAEHAQRRHAEVQNTLEEWQQFLTLDASGKHERYELYHDSFRDFLSRLRSVKGAAECMSQSRTEISSVVVERHVIHDPHLEEYEEYLESSSFRSDVLARRRDAIRALGGCVLFHNVALEGTAVVLYIVWRQAAGNAGSNAEHS